MSSNLRRLCEERTRPIVTAELPTIDSGGLDEVRRHAEPLREYVDAINATDNTAAHAHASNTAIAIALERLGIEPVLQVVCRDKNRLALQADILGAALHGVVNIACLTGDDVTAGDEPEARRVFDCDGPQLVSIAASLRAGTTLSGRPLDPAPDLFLGAVENPGAPPLEHRPVRAAKKVAAGARFLQLQISYRPDQLEAFVEACTALGVSARCAILPTICLVSGDRALRFMDEQVPGISVPAATIERVASSSAPGEEAYRLGLEQARHALSVPGVAGIHVTSFRRDNAIPRLCDDLGLFVGDRTPPQLEVAS
ncbi:MAG: methylenetetrahydrofolate reductase [Gaiellales bacterium]|nr:methylenetetrahydrofolate reductase [Gaiellales bacterium]